MAEYQIVTDWDTEKVSKIISLGTKSPVVERVNKNQQNNVRKKPNNIGSKVFTVIFLGALVFIGMTAYNVFMSKKEEVSTLQKDNTEVQKRIENPVKKKQPKKTEEQSNDVATLEAKPEVKSDVSQVENIQPKVVKEVKKNEVRDDVVIKPSASEELSSLKGL